MSDFINAMLAEDDVAYVDETAQSVMCRVCNVYVALRTQFDPPPTVPATNEQRRRWKLDWSMHRQNHLNSRPSSSATVSSARERTQPTPRVRPDITRPISPSHQLGLNLSHHPSSSSHLYPSSTHHSLAHSHPHPPTLMTTSLPQHARYSSHVSPIHHRSQYAAHSPQSYAVPEEIAQQRLLSDAHALSVEPHRVLCADCHQWIPLDTQTRFNPRNWERHQLDCRSTSRTVKPKSSRDHAHHHPAISGSSHGSPSNHYVPIAPSPPTASRHPPRDYVREIALEHHSNHHNANPAAPSSKKPKTRSILPATLAPPRPIAIAPSPSPPTFMGYTPLPRRTQSYPTPHAPQQQQPQQPQHHSGAAAGVLPTRSIGSHDSSGPSSAASSPRRNPMSISSLLMDGQSAATQSQSAAPAVPVHRTPNLGSSALATPPQVYPALQPSSRHGHATSAGDRHYSHGHPPHPRRHSQSQSHPESSTAGYVRHHPDSRSGAVPVPLATTTARAASPPSPLRAFGSPRTRQRILGMSNSNLPAAMILDHYRRTGKILQAHRSPQAQNLPDPSGGPGGSGAGGNSAASQTQPQSQVHRGLGLMRMGDRERTEFDAARERERGRKRTRDGDVKDEREESVPVGHVHGHRSYSAGYHRPHRQQHQQQQHQTYKSPRGDFPTLKPREEQDGPSTAPHHSTSRSREGEMTEHERMKRAGAAAEGGGRVAGTTSAPATASGSTSSGDSPLLPVTPSPREETMASLHGQSAPTSPLQTEINGERNVTRNGTDSAGGSGEASRVRGTWGKGGAWAGLEIETRISHSKSRENRVSSTGRANVDGPIDSPVSALQEPIANLSISRYGRSDPSAPSPGPSPIQYPSPVQNSNSAVNTIVIDGPQDQSPPSSSNSSSTPAGGQPSDSTTKANTPTFPLRPANFSARRIDYDAASRAARHHSPEVVPIWTPTPCKEWKAPEWERLPSYGSQSC